MCLYVDDDGWWRVLDQGSHRARVNHTCSECSRTIDPGETYWYWVQVEDTHYSRGREFQTWKMCAHCWGTVELGSALTGCPKSWVWEEVHSLDMDYGFVGNIIYDEGHDLSRAQHIKMLRTVAGRKRGWRRKDGSLLPIPA